MTFPKMSEVLAEGTKGDVTIEHFTVSDEESQFTALRGGMGYVPAGDYVRLLISGAVVMSDTRMEQFTNYDVLRESKGRVFIAGLGLGMICHGIAAKPEVSKITVLELNENVIDLVAPSLPEKVEVNQGDIFEYKPGRWEQFDTIYFDVWNDICTDNLPQMGKLFRRFRKHLAPNGWMDCWCRDYLKKQRRKELQQERELSAWRL